MLLDISSLKNQFYVYIPTTNSPITKKNDAIYSNIKNANPSRIAQPNTPFPFCLLI